jgi:hypothetical protein
MTALPISSFISLISAGWNALGRRKERRAKACAAFRETFHQQLLGLYPLPSNWPAGTEIQHRLKAAFPALQAAVSVFRSQLSKSNQTAFDEAWLLYRTATKREIDVQCYDHYMNFTTTTVSTFGGETSIAQNGKEAFKRNVGRLLAFAKE